jgi:hypothetical protein
MKLRIRYKHWICTHAPFLGYPAGIVLYPFMLFKRSKEEVTDKLFRHELEHVYQVRRLGWLRFYLTYLWYQITKGYKNNPFEIEANANEDLPLTDEERALKDNS